MSEGDLPLPGYADSRRIELVTCLREGEEHIARAERLARLRLHGYTPLGQEAFSHLWDNKHLIPDAWKKHTKMMEPDDYYTHDPMYAMIAERTGDLSPPPLKVREFPTYIYFEDAVTNLGDNRLHRHMPDGTVVKEALLVTMSLVWTGHEWSRAEGHYDIRRANQPAAVVRL